MIIHCDYIDAVGPQAAEVENVTAVEANLETSHLLEQVCSSLILTKLGMILIRYEDRSLTRRCAVSSPRELIPQGPGSAS